MIFPPSARPGAVRCLWTVALFCVTACVTNCVHGPNPNDYEEVVLVADDTVIERSCRLRIPPGTVIADRNGDGVLHIRGADVAVHFVAGSALRGAAAGTAWDQLQGTGIRVIGESKVQIHGAKVHGFKVGIHASDADGLRLVGCDVSDCFRQRLRSTAEAEVTTDWLSPHDNDQHQWMRRYGAGIYIERSRDVQVSRCRARRGQNGLILDRVERSAIFDNDFSFLSGWGVALWRSNHNQVTRNALDFCIRGYSHGVYNRGQDSAGILMFEQCSHNLIAENSATHGGDGFFAFSGKEALGQRPAPSESFSYTRRGHTDNLIIANDFSYAAAHGLELTFGFGNRIHLNRLVGNAICGIWGGYSQDTAVGGNTIADNGDRGYGMERGGINIEHGAGNLIYENDFANNRCGVHLWDDPDEGLMGLDWAKANHRGCVDNAILNNRFAGDELALHLREAKSTTFDGNHLDRVGKILDATKSAAPRAVAEGATIDLPSIRPDYTAPGTARPVGARVRLRGRDKIIMDDWGPWDHESPLVRLSRLKSGADLWQLFGIAGEVRASVVSGDVKILASSSGASSPQSIRIAARGNGVFPYEVHLTGAGLDRRLVGRLLALTWDISVFPWTTDPRKDLAAWRREATKGALHTTARSLNLAYGGGGPRDLKLSKAIQAKGPGRDRFGTIARTKLRLLPGRYKVTTRSDDGVRVLAAGETVIENWTHHGPTIDHGEFTVERGGAIELVVEHFELDGHACLSLDLQELHGRGR